MEVTFCLSDSRIARLYLPVVVFTVLHTADPLKMQKPQIWLEDSVRLSKISEFSVDTAWNLDLEKLNS